jgi:hypothetical protein
MRVIVSVLACFATTAPAMSGQAAGDSIRLRIPPSRAWTHGRLVSLESGQLIVNQAAHDQTYAVQNIGRFEVRRRKNRAATLVGDTIACAAGAAIGGLVRPKNTRPLFGSDGANIGVAAGVGFVVGLIELSVSPWHWKRVRVGVRAGP